MKMSLNEQIAYINERIYRAMKVKNTFVDISLAFPCQEIYTLLAQEGYKVSHLMSSGKKDGVQNFMISWRTEDEIKEARADLKRMVDGYMKSNNERNNKFLKTSNSHAIQR